MPYDTIDFIYRYFYRYREKLQILKIYFVSYLYKYNGKIVHQRIICNNYTSLGIYRELWFIIDDMQQKTCQG